jgi:hypothetical protein
MANETVKARHKRRSIERKRKNQSARCDGIAVVAAANRETWPQQGGRYA